MEELKKKPEFMLAKDYDNSLLNWEPINMSNVKGLLDLPTPEHQALEEYSKSFKMNKDIYEDLARLNEPKEATVGEKMKAGIDRLVLDIKNTPETIKNAMYRHSDGLSFPNANAEEAWQITKANTYALQDLRERQAEKEQREGTSDSWLATLIEAGGQSALFGLTSALSPVGGLALMSAKEMADTQQEWAYQAYEKGEELKGTDILAADGVGLINGWLENALGVERLGRQIVTRTMLGRFAKTVGKTAAEEGAEEFVQAGVSSLFGSITGNDNRTFGEMLSDATTQAVFGAIVGGTLGSGGYFLGRRRMMTNLSKAGFTEEEAKQITDEIIDTGKSAVIEELRARNELTEGYGEAYDKLAQRVEEAFRKVGWEEKNPDKDLREFAKLSAKTIVAPAIAFSNETKMPMNEFLDLLQVESDGNVFYLRMTDVNNVDAIVKQVKENKEEIKNLKGEIGIDNKKPIAELQEKNKILEKRLKNLGYVEEKKARVRNREKANQDQKVLASTKSEVLGDLASIRKANETEKFVYVGNSRVAVKYVVKPMAEVQASHVAGVANPNYTFKELQNRTRGTVVDDAILQNRAANLRPEELAESPNTQYGAPVVNLNGEIISGNGRYETLRRAYELGDKSYVKMLKKLGYNVEGIERPILVRETVDNLTTEQQIAIAEASNVSETSAFDHARQASNDAKYLKKGIADPRTFGDSLPVEERQAYIREDGTYDLLALQRRFDDAVMAWILDDTKVFDALVLSDKIDGKIMKGLSMQGGSIVDFQNNYPQIGLREDLKYALIKSASIRTRGQFIPAIQQQDVESGTTFSADALLYFMKFSKNSSELSNCLEAYVSKHQGYLESEKNNLFGDALPKQSKEDITAQVLRGVNLEDDAFTKEGAANNANIKAIFANQIPVEDVAYGTVNPELGQGKLFQEELSIAVENARLDTIYPEYKGETINIDGEERTVYNSNGDRIAKSKEALENFYRWFGDSKVVDKQGRPLVVYHGTNKKFDTFDKGKIGKKHKDLYQGKGFYFTSEYYDAQNYGRRIMPVYLKIENPALSDYNLKPENDGISAAHGVWVAFEPNQIKSTSNRGTYSESENIYYQDEEEYHILPDNIKNQELNILEINDKNIKTKSEVQEELQRLIDSGFKETTKDGKVLKLINRVYKKGEPSKSYKVARHIAYSSKARQPEIRNNAVFDLANLITNSVFVEEDISKQNKKGYDKALRFYSAVKAGNEIYPVRIVALHKENTDSFDLSGNVYDIIFEEKKQEVAKSPLKESTIDTGAKLPDKIIVSDLLNLVKASDGKFYKQGSKFNGFFDADLKTIVIGSNFNFGTLQHEVAHYYLDRIFEIYKSGYGTQEFKDFAERLFSILNVDPQQTKLSRDQQEQFASMTEAYLFNKGIFPDGAEPAMKMFFDWCPPQYNTIANVGYHNEKEEFVPALFNKESLELFDAMYSEVPYMAEPNFAKSFENPVMTDGSQPKATQEEQENRKKLIDSQIVEEPVEPLTTQSEGVQEAYFEGRNREDPLVKEAYEEAIETAQEKPKTATEKFIQYVLPGRGTNTRADMDRVAQEYIANNRENAERVAFGSPIPQSTADMMGVEPTSDYVENNTGIDRAVLTLNLMKEYSENSPEYQQLYHNFAMHRSYASKSAGLTNDVSTNFYMKGYSTIEKAIAERAAVVRYGAKKNSINRFNADIDNFIKANIDSVIKTLPDTAERDRAVREVVEKMNAMFGSEDSAFFQEDLTARKIRKGDKAAFTSWATRKIRRIQAGKETADYSLEELMRVSIMAQKTLPDLNSNDPDKAVNASRNIREWQDFVNNKSKGLSDSAINKFIGEYMPRAMLSAPSTHIKNNVSNAINYVMTKAAMRFHFGENRVSEYLTKKEQDRLWTIYKATGQNLTDSMTADQVSRLHGERYMIPEAKGFLQSIDPFRWLGYEDFYFRSHMYLDTLGRIATQDANGDPIRAGELFNEYKKLGTTGRAKEARQQAIIAGNMAVFTQDGTLSKIVSNVRGELNRINFTQFGEKGHQGLGTLIAPFAKVPSNIVGMGIEAMASPFKALSYNLYKTTGIKGFKNNWTIQDSIALTNFGGLVASVLAMIAAGADYEPPYEVGRKYEQNKPYDSVRLGGVWISLESFGALATPLRFTLTCLKGVERRQDPNKIIGTAFDTVARDIPFTDFSYEYFMKKPVDWIKNETYNQASKAIPAIVKTPIRLAMRETGITITPERGGFIPQNIQRKFARQYGLDGQENSVNDFIRFLYNGVTIEE